MSDASYYAQAAKSHRDRFVLSRRAVEGLDAIHGTDEQLDGISFHIPAISGECAIGVDDAGDILFGKNIHKRVKIASITKLMTAIIASEYDMSTMVDVTHLASHIDGSSCNLEQGDKAKIRELLKGLLMPSGNDAAYAIAGALGKKMLDDDGDANGRSDEESGEMACIERFVFEMNQRAQELDMRDTVFANPCGLDEDDVEKEHLSSAYDVHLMAKRAYGIEVVRDIVGEYTDKMSIIRKGNQCELPLSNTNKLLRLRDDVRGMKTGTTDGAGYCFAGVFGEKCAEEHDAKEQRSFYTVVLGAESRDAVFVSSVDLYEWMKDDISKR